MGHKERSPLQSKKSQILCIKLDEMTSTQQVHLGGVSLQWVEQVEYLGVRLSKDGILGKDPKEVENKCKAIAHMLINEEWFSLDLELKKIVREFISRVSSILMYGAELLTHDARKPFIVADRVVSSLIFVKLLKLGGRALCNKHRLRLQIAMGLPNFDMEEDTLVKNRVATWIAKRTSTVAQISGRVNDSLKDIRQLDADHPLREALGKAKPNTTDRTDVDQEAWTEIKLASKGPTPNPVDRQFVAAAAMNPQHATTRRLSFIEEPNVGGALRKAALRWSIYRFPVRYTPTPEENARLAQLPKWQDLFTELQSKTMNNLLTVYNREESL